MTPDTINTPPTQIMPPENITFPSISTENLDTGGKNKDFGGYKNNQDNTNTKGKFSMDISHATIGITFFIFIGLIFLGLTKINIWSETKNSNYTNIVNTYKNYVNSIDNIIGYPGINESRKIITSITDENINIVINSIIPFMFKKDILEETVAKIIESILNKNKELQDITKEINKYGFIHPDIMSILDKTKDQIPIMISLHTLETIKFGTAFKIFSMLDTFLQQASQTLNLPKDDIIKAMESYNKIGEKNIANYLSMCYLNPYEKSANCDQINDFNNYFIYEDKKNKINTTLFANLITLIESKLEQSEIPSLQIKFNRFNPNVKNIGFQVTINTLAEDDIAFMTRGIINPHVFIISTLVSLLKQSFFVIGSSIDINNLNIKQQNINVGNIQIPVSTSSMTFDLPLQNPSEREIFDFYQPDDS